jgi:hypothetical protein
MDLQVGKIYHVAGYGPMRIVQLPDPPQKTTITLVQPAGTTFYSSAEHITGEDTAGEWDVHVKYAEGKLTWDEFRIALARLYEEAP